MTWSCTIQLLAPALVLFFCNMQNCVNNNRLLMMPQLVRAQSAYKDIRICSFHHTHTHTHTHYKYMHYWWWVGTRSKWQISMQKRVFSSDLEESREWRWDREEESSRSQVWCIKRISPPGPPGHPWNTEDPSIWGWAKRARRRVEMKRKPTQSLSLIHIWRCRRWP